MSDKGDEEGCKYAFSPTEIELRAFKWLFEYLNLVCDCKLDSAENATAVRRVCIGGVSFNYPCTDESMI